MKKSNSKLSKNEPENIPQIKITWYFFKNLFLIESDSWTDQITLFISVKTP